MVYPAAEKKADQPAPEKEKAVKNKVKSK